MNKFSRRVYVGVVVFLLLVGMLLVGYRLYDRHWLTGAERKTAIRAVYSVDSMDNLEISKAAYLQRENETQKLLANAHIAARTQKDKIVVLYLEEYFNSVQLKRSSSDIQESDLNTAESLKQLKQTDPYRAALLSKYVATLLSDRRSMQSAKDNWRKEAAEDRARLMGEVGEWE